MIEGRGLLNKLLCPGRIRVNRTERTVRIGITIALVGWGLLVLNHCIYSFWLASGPPNDYPNVWYQRGIKDGWLALTFIAAGVFVQFKWVTVKNNWLVRVCSLSLVIGMVYPQAREFFLIDHCLDSGGSWSVEYFECQH